jgi:hypothetical protein
VSKTDKACRNGPERAGLDQTRLSQKELDAIKLHLNRFALLPAVLASLAVPVQPEICQPVVGAAPLKEIASPAR